jgi:hypothetical protein
MYMMTGKGSAATTKAIDTEHPWHPSLRTYEPVPVPIECAPPLRRLRGPRRASCFDPWLNCLLAGLLACLAACLAACWMEQQEGAVEKDPYPPRRKERGGGSDVIRNFTVCPACSRRDASHEKTGLDPNPVPHYFTVNIK